MESVDQVTGQSEEQFETEEDRERMDAFRRAAGQDFEDLVGRLENTWDDENPGPDEDTLARMRAHAMDILDTAGELPDEVFVAAITDVIIQLACWCPAPLGILALEEARETAVRFFGEDFAGVLEEAGRAKARREKPRRPE